MMLSAGVAFIYFFFLCSDFSLLLSSDLLCRCFFWETDLCLFVSCLSMSCMSTQTSMCNRIVLLCEQFFFSINQHWNGMGSFSAVWVFCVNFILLSWNPVFLCTLMYSSCLFLLLPDQWQAVMPTCSLHRLLIFLFLLAHLLFCHIFPFLCFFLLLPCLFNRYFAPSSHRLFSFVTNFAFHIFTLFRCEFSVCTWTHRNGI